MRWTETNLECGGFFSKLFEPRHGRNVLKVMFHLVAKAHVQTADIGEARDSEIKMKNMESIARKDFTEKSRLYAHV